jgi:hypothetical protein
MSGAQMRLGTGDLRQVVDFEFRGGAGRSSGRSNGLNDRNQVAFKARFEGGPTTGAIVIAQEDSFETPYDQWTSDHALAGVDRDFGADPDEDGFQNGIEYAMGSIPISAQSLPEFPEPLQIRTSGRIQYKLFKPGGVVGVLYVVERSADLLAWTDRDLEKVEDDQSTLTVLTVEAPLIPVFFRLRIELAQPGE